MINKVGIFNNLKKMVQSKPMIRGMITYSITWPIGNLIQQTFELEKYNLAQTLKFGLYGSLYVAPTIHKWMQFSCYLWPKNTIEHTILKVRKVIFISAMFYENLFT